MRIRVLGSAAGGGVPQWNCGCPNCQGIRSGSIRASARRQESVAVSADGRSWLLLNASPEIRAQIESFPPLWPQRPRHSPIAGIVLTNGDLDHELGLLSLRESHPITIFATDAVRRGFTEGNVLYRTLERFEGQVTWRSLVLGREMPIVSPGGAPAGETEEGASTNAAADLSLFLTPFPVPGKRPIHLEGIGPPSDEDNVGLIIRARPAAPAAASTATPAATDARVATRPDGVALAYVPAAAAWTPELQERLAAVDAVFFDGTFWSSAELVTAGVGTKHAEDMAHLPVGGMDGGLSRLAQLGARRRVLIHINNTNPLLREDSAERAVVTAAGVEIAYDDMELVL